MANVITRTIPTISMDGVVRIVPLGDIHIGAAACDEEHFMRTVKYIKDEGVYWIGMGDYCDFINKSDKRFSLSLAPWIGISELGDLAKHQKNRFLEIVNPIASKCLGLLKGNHEDTILRKYERDIYSDIVTGIKEAGGMKDVDSMALGYSGWIRLRFTRKGNDKDRRNILIYLHHGFVGGKLAGAKALNMQRLLWNHEADLIVMGHSHNISIQRESVEYIDDADNVAIRDKIGCFSGTYLKNSQEGTTTYSEVKGYFPLPTGGVEVFLTPYKNPKVKVMT